MRDLFVETIEYVERARSVPIMPPLRRAFRGTRGTQLASPDQSAAQSKAAAAAAGSSRRQGAAGQALTLHPTSITTPPPVAAGTTRLPYYGM